MRCWLISYVGFDKEDKPHFGRFEVLSPGSLLTESRILEEENRMQKKHKLKNCVTLAISEVQLG